jgi:hypothetical protein
VERRRAACDGGRLSPNAVISLASPSPTLPPRPRHEAPLEVYLSLAVLGDVSAQVDARFPAAARRVQWRHWPVGGRPGPLCAWTTSLAEGRYWSFAAVPVGRGARSLAPARLVVAPDSWLAHRLRRDARLRARDLRDQLHAGRPRPWRQA